MVRICGVPTTLNVHRNRGGQQLCFLRVLARISRLSYNINWHKNRGRSRARFSGKRKSIQSVRTCKEFKGSYCHKLWVHFSRYCDVFKAFVLLGFSYSVGRILGKNFKDSPYIIYSRDSRTVYGFLGQKSRSFSRQF